MTVAAQIKETTAAIRTISNELNNGKVYYARKVRLSDRLHDLQARYATLLRSAGLEPA